MALVDKSRLVPLGALVGWCVVRGLGVLTRQQKLRPEEALRLAGSEPAILVMWHEETALAATYLRILTHLRRVVVLASHSNDGELVARIARRSGVQVARGSASRGGREGLRALYRAVAKQGASPLIMTDGPRGPAHVVKPGAIVLAQMTGAPILPLHFACNSCWHLGSWDRMAVPKPLRKVSLRVGDFISVPRQLEENQVAELQTEVADALFALREANYPA